MKIYRPDIYQKDVFSINYEKLKQKKIKVLIYDIDDTLIPSNEIKLKKETINLITKLKNNNILLEICPTSNVQTNSVDIYQNHPIKLFSLLGVLYSINTDNRLVSNINLSSEYKKLIDYNLITIEAIIKSNLNAIKHSFLTEEEKVLLFKKYNDLLRDM